MADPLKIPIRASTQAHLEIEDIQDDLVILKDGGAALVLKTTAVNFGLLSEREQDATIFAYAALLNSLTFSLQIIIRSQKKDIGGYLKQLKKAEKKEKEPKIKAQIQKYQKFIEKIVTQNEVLDKKFYLVIPMSPLELGAAKSILSNIKPKKGLPFPKKLILEKAKNSLFPKKDHLIKQLARLGLKASQLTTQELIELYFEIYNPEASKEPLSQAEEYQVPLVQKKPGSAPAPEPADSKNKPKKEKDLQNEISQLVENSVTKEEKHET